MDLKTAITLAVTVALAITGYLAKYITDLRIARRKDRLERISKQLSEFYGPLFALASSGHASWEAFKKRYRPGTMFWASKPPPTEEEAAAYRLWMSEVFMPINVEMADIVTHKADLLEESQIPKELLDLCAHVAARQAVLRRWEDRDYSEHTYGVSFPAKYCPMLHPISTCSRKSKMRSLASLNVDASPQFTNGAWPRPTGESPQAAYLSMA